MKQIRLDDNFDLAIDGNEAWVIDYSQGLHNPKPGVKHIFDFGEPANITIEAHDPNIAVITYQIGDYVVRKQAQIHGPDFIAFEDIDAPYGRHEDGRPATQEDVEQIEKEYQENLRDIHTQFLKDSAELEKPENRDVVKFIELEKDLKRHIENLSLQRHRKIEALKPSPWHRS